MSLNKTYIENAAFVLGKVAESVGKSDVFVGSGHAVPGV